MVSSDASAPSSTSLDSSESPRGIVVVVDDELPTVAPTVEKPSGTATSAQPLPRRSPSDSKKTWLALGLGMTCLLFVVSALLWMTTCSTGAMSGRVENQPSGLEDRVTRFSLQGGQEFNYPDSYHAKALLRMKSQSLRLSQYSDQRLKQVYSLLSLHFATNEKETWKKYLTWRFSGTDKDAASLSSLTHLHDECEWNGVVCDSDKKVVALDLASFGLDGALPLEITLLEFLATLRLDNNPGLGGPIPRFLGFMPSLTSLTMTGCSYVGEIPDRVCDAALETLQVDCLEKISCDATCCSVCT